ncbi:MAG: GTP-binding protein [Promethearchaeota archaeon]|nr:MAG: GTP-binding protein [Candidatus Lokiarchaeota archaeon]
MLQATLLEELLANFLNQIKDVIGILIVDLDGLIIARQSVKNFDEEIIGAIMSVLEGSLHKIKRFTDTSYGSGTLDTNEFRLFYLELGNVGSTRALFVLVADPFADINKYIPYSYLAAEKASQILSERKVSTHLPKLANGGRLKLISEERSNGTKIINKIILIGEDSVGKSAIANMYVNGEFYEEYTPTLGISIHNKELQITKDIKIIFSLFDLGGLKSFAKVRRHFYQDSKAVLIVFDYSRPETLKMMDGWIEEARHFIKNSHVPYIIIGNKMDTLKDKTEIRTAAQNLANQYNFQFFETSASTGEGIDELFMYLTSNLGI